MPKKPRKKVGRRGKGIPLSEMQLIHLIHGEWILDDKVFPFESEQHRLQCWERHKTQIFQQCMTEDASIFKPTFKPGSRPAAWWEYTEGLPEREVKVTKIQPGNRYYPDGLWIENREVESEPDYLDRTHKWLPGEKQRYVKMVEAAQAEMKKLSKVVDLDEYRELNETVRKAKQEYED